MKIKIKNKKQLNQYLLNNIKTFFNASYVNNNIVFDNGKIFKVDIKEN